ncbi:hypothetical protein Btru_069463 [Bulinus truncatus]|nr:hypothetical protein Btru_069463 [Bulinus truncatus]
MQSKRNTTISNNNTSTSTKSKNATTFPVNTKIRSPPAQSAKNTKNVNTSKTSSKTEIGLGKSTSQTKKIVGKQKGKENVPKPTAKDLAAIKIQTAVRRFLAKKTVEKRKREKQEYEEKMQELDKQAYLYLCKLEQEKAEKQHKKEEEEKKRKQDELKRKKQLLEAAYDGNIIVMKQILKEISDIDDKNGLGNDIIGRSLRSKHIMCIIECEDANGNTALSEAANGGHADAIKFLLEHGADPNTIGQFRRTPLYRAAFAGHLEATYILLENGADPRILGGDSQSPAEVASIPAVKEVLENWDVTTTDKLLKQLEAFKEKRLNEDKERRQAETNKLEVCVAEAEKEYKAKQKKLEFVYCELNKRIREHDLCVAQGFDKPELTEAAIHDQELEVESAKLELETAREQLAKTRLALRETTKKTDEETEEELQGLKVVIKELDDVLFRDVGNRISDSGKWPLVIDISGQAGTFLRYRDTNYICSLRPADMDINNIRLGLLGALRYGKPLVLDMMEVDMFETCVDMFDQVMKDLMTSIIDKTILKEEKYKKLIKPTDGADYEVTKFNETRVSKFMFIILTKNPIPNDKLMQLIFEVHIQKNKKYKRTILTIFFINIYVRHKSKKITVCYLVPHN